MTSSPWSVVTAHPVMPARRIGIIVALGATLLLATLVCGSALFLERARQTALHAANATLQNAALVVTTTINRELLQVDGALVSLPSIFATAGNQKGDVDPDAARRLLRAFNFETFSFRDLLLVHPDGTIWVTARPRPANQRLLLTPPEAGAAQHPGTVAVEGPIYNGTTGDWSWYLSRPISLSGVGQLQAVAEVPVPSILALLAPVAAVPGLQIYIQRPDGSRLASFPNDELKVGKYQVVAFSRLGPESVAFGLPSTVITTPTVAVWRNTLYPDVQVALTLDLSVALADWVRDRDRLLIVLALACLLVLALAGTLYAALRQRERVETERKKSRDLLDSAIEAMSDGFVMWDEQDRLLACNHRFREIYALSAPFIHPGAKFEDIIREGAKIGQYPQAGDNIEGFVRETLEWHHGNQGSLERLLPDGRWVLITERQNPTGGIVGIRTDITIIKQTLAELAEANERANRAVEEVRLHNLTLTERDHELRVRNMLFTAALNNMSQGLLMVDSDRRVIVCNKRFHDMFRISASDASPGTTTASLFHAIENRAGLSPRAVESIYQQQEELAASQRGGTFVSTEDDALALAVSQRPLPDGGWIATYEDVTERQQTETRIRFLAHHDALTNLPNRVLFRSKIAEALSQLTADGNDLALLYLDLDRFKLINDTLGHPAGDALLEVAARRLQGCIRSTDFVARLGGDEFAVLYPSRDLPGAATAQAQRIIESLSAPYQLGHRKVEIGASIGIAIAAGPNINGDTLLRNADMALYQAKARGRGAFCVFEPDMEVRLHARLSSEADLRVALDQHQFEIYYQPVLDLRSDRVHKFEALLRWNHPERGLVMPGQFIPLAEELGIIKSIGAWILRQACLDAVHHLGGAQVAVNLSPIQLEDGDIVEIVSDAITGAGLDPARLEIEITKSALLNNSVQTTALLRELHDLGLSIALDDFGTGYSSLSYLRSFPFDVIKIDRLFISELTTRDDCAAIVAAIVSLADRLGMTTTAEGVETNEQVRLVRELGCTSIQGYLLGRPQPICKAVEYFDVRLERAIAFSEAQN